MMESRDLHLLIAEYVSRQQLVVRVMTRVRPDKFAAADQNLSDMDTLRIAEQYKTAPFSGLWEEHGYWHYTIHGSGCRLVNLITGEPLDWDVPDPLVFDKWFFRFWWQWLSKHNPETFNVDEQSVDQMFEVLEQLSIITQLKTGKYRIIAKIDDSLNRDKPLSQR
jgi:hypothetical protein